MTEVATGTMRQSLKEWRVVVDALTGGVVSVLLRKGGIREQRAGFSVRHDAFLLYPTYFHTDASQLSTAVRPLLSAASAPPPPEGTVQISAFANVRAVWRVTELELLKPILHMQPLAWEAIEARFNYRNTPLIHAVAVEVFNLAEPCSLPETRRYQGCVSWVRLDEGISIANASPALPESAVDANLVYLQKMLGAPLARD